MTFLGAFSQRRTEASDEAGWHHPLRIQRAVKHGICLSSAPTLYKRAKCKVKPISEHDDHKDPAPAVLELACLKRLGDLLFNMVFVLWARRSMPEISELHTFIGPLMKTCHEYVRQLLDVARIVVPCSPRILVRVVE